jgi:hypothetical protein
LPVIAAASVCAAVAAAAAAVGLPLLPRLRPCIAFLVVAALQRHLPLLSLLPLLLLLLLLPRACCWSTPPLPSPPPPPSSWFLPGAGTTLCMGAWAIAWVQLHLVALLLGFCLAGWD